MAHRLLAGIAAAVPGALLIQPPPDLVRTWNLAAYPWCWPLVIGGLFFFGAGVLLLIALVIPYREAFKHRVMVPLVGFVHPNLKYDSYSGISDGEFQRAGLFQDRVNAYKSEDLVFGTVGSTAIEFAEIKAQHRSGSGTRGNRTQTIFRGLLFTADFNKHFAGNTIVLPDRAERLLGRLGQALQGSLAPRGFGELVKLEDPEFERAFVVYSDDQVEARYILSTSLMRRILELRSKVSKKLRLSFRDSKRYLAIPLERDLFEAPVFRSVLRPRVVETFVEDLQMAVGVVEDLHLNTRIWTKR